MPDFAAISVAAVGVILLVLLCVQFFLWLQVKFELKASILKWEKDISVHTSRSDAIPGLLQAIAEIRADIIKGTLSQEAHAESFRHLQLKIVSRDREVEKARKRDEKETPVEVPKDPGDALAAALAAQGGFPAGFYPPGANGQEPERPKRLRVK